MDGFKNSTKTKYMSEGGTFDGRGTPAKKPMASGSGAAAAALAASKKVADMAQPTGSVKPLYRDRDPKSAMRTSDTERYAGSVKPLYRDRAQPVQKKSIGGVLKALSPAAALIGSDVGKDLMKSGVFGVGGLLASQLMKKKQSGQVLSPAEDKQLAQSQQGGQATMKKGGPVKKGVPVASKRPMVGLAAMPKKK